MYKMFRNLKIVPFVCLGLACAISFSQINPQTERRVIEVNAEGEIESTYKYVSDLKIAVADKASDAVKQLTEAGYECAPYDLNRGGERYVYMGYKTSNSVLDAITSVKCLNMTTGYEELNYKDFLSENAKGLPATVDGFQLAIRKMKENYFANDPLAKYAFNNLNILCVPESSKDKTGPGLANYLIDHVEDYNLMEDLILILQPNTYTFINDQLAIACSGNYVNENEGEYLSTWESNKYFLDEIFMNAMEICSKYSDIANESISENDLILKNEVKLEAMLSDENFANIITAEAINELKNVRAFVSYGGKTYKDLYEILSSDCKFLQACVVEALPYTIEPANFISFVIDYAGDPDKKAPGEVPNLPEVVSPVFEKVVKYMNSFVGDPYDYDEARSIIEDYGGPTEELDFFIQLAENFINEYYNQLYEARDVLEDYGWELSLVEILQKLAAKNKEEAEAAGDNKLYHDAYFYLMPCEVLKTYKFKRNQFLTRFDDYGEEVDVTNLFGLLEYMIDAYYYESESCVSQAIAAMFLQAMDEQDLYLLKTCSIPVYTLTATVNPTKNTEFTEQLEQNKQTIIDAYVASGYEENECSVWAGTNKDLLEESLVCQTDSTIRQKVIDDEFKNSLLQVENDKHYLDKISDALEIAGLAMAGLGVFMAVGQAVAMSAIGAGTGFMALMDMGCFTMVGMGSAYGLSTAGAIAAVTSFLSTFLFAILFVVMIILIILLFTLLAPDSQPEYERVSIPKIMIDCQKENNGTVKKAVRYDLVQAVDGKDADTNGYRPGDDDYDETVWNSLYYTKSTDIGSPLIVTDDGTFVSTSTSTGPSKSVPVSTFGYNSPYNLNNLHPDSNKQVYLHYFTVDSVNGTVPQEEKMGKYVERIVMATSPNRGVAINALKLKGEEYNIIDYDLTQGIEDYTYIAFKTTNNEKEAVTDIRAAVGTSSYNFNWGDASNPYISVYDSSEVSCPINTPKDSRIDGAEDGDPSLIYWNLYCSYSKNVGDPILASSLSVITSLDQLEDGYECARWFSGGAFDFAVQKEDSDHFAKHRFLQYASEEKYRHYKNETKYLAGFMFFSYSSNWIPNSPKSLKSYAEEIGCTIIDNDLTKGYLHDSADVTYMGYATTTNPKKAVTDIGVFTSEPQSQGILLDNIVQSSTFFESCVTVYAGDKDYAGTSAFDKERMVRFSHAYITSVDSEAHVFETRDQGYSIRVRARGLYCAGPQAGVDPILLSNVVYSKTHNTTPSSFGNNNKLYSLSSGQALNESLDGTWFSVHGLDRFFYDEYDASGDLLTPGVNLSLAQDESKDFDNTFFLFYKNGSEKKVRGNYVASLELVGYESDSYHEHKYAYDEFYMRYGHNTKYQVDYLRERCRFVELSYYQDQVNSARYMAMGAGQEIVNLDYPLNFTGNGAFSSDNLFYDFYDKGFYSSNCTYLVVSYTNKKSNAIGGAIITDKSNPTTLSVDYEYSAEPYSYIKGRYDDGNHPVTKANTKCIYTTRSGNPINRVAIMSNNSQLTNNSIQGTMNYVTDENLNIFEGTSVNSKRVSIGLISYEVPEYISDIIFSTDYGSSDMFRADANAKGYKEFTSFDYYHKIAGISQKVRAGIARTNDSGKALKDIRISNKNLGISTIINGRVYRRLNNTSLCPTGINRYGVLAPSAFVYATTGNDLEQNKNPKYPYYGERVAITNFGFAVDGLSEEGRDYIMWNGEVTENGSTRSGEPKDITANTAIHYVTDENGNELTSFDFNGNMSQIILGTGGNKNTYCDINVNIVYTNHSGYNMLDYEKGFGEGALTGYKKTDPLGLGSAISNSPLFIAILSSGLVGLGVTLTYVFIRRKRKPMVSSGSEEN